MRPWYLLLAMVGSWMIGVLGLLNSSDTISFFRQNSVPDVSAILHDLGSAADPGKEIVALGVAAHLRALSDMARIALPLFVGKLILSVLLVITTSMAMNGRPGTRNITIQAHLAFAALSAAMFWLLRDARYATINVMSSIHPLVPKLFASEPQQIRDFYSTLLDKSWLLSSSRLFMAIFDVGALLVGATTLLTARTKSFFDAVESTTEDSEDL